jgi:hypothetical protein
VAEQHRGRSRGLGNQITLGYGRVAHTPAFVIAAIRL